MDISYSSRPHNYYLIYSLAFYNSIQIGSLLLILVKDLHTHITVNFNLSELLFHTHSQILHLYSMPVLLSLPSSEPENHISRSFLEVGIGLRKRGTPKGKSYFLPNYIIWKNLSRYKKQVMYRDLVLDIQHNIKKY